MKLHSPAANPVSQCGSMIYGVVTKEDLTVGTTLGKAFSAHEINLGS